MGKWKGKLAKKKNKEES